MVNADEIIGDRGDTIYAPITALQMSGAALIRVSGSRAIEFLERTVNPSKYRYIKKNPRKAVFSEVLVLNTTSRDLEVLDHALIIYFKAPNSFTGEDTVEYHIHGSLYLVEKFCRELLVLGAREARPGEFSERAFLNGKLDLSQAEAVCDLISSQTESQARAARAQLEGTLRTAISELGEPLRDLLSEIEALIDFPEEEIDSEISTLWEIVINRVTESIDRFIESYAQGRIIKDGAKVVLLGKPNAGKSSLLNLLVGEERVIVSPIAGTTRDSVQCSISLNGLLVSLWDTAGIRDEGQLNLVDELEKKGIEQSLRRIREADLVLVVLDLDEYLEDLSDREKNSNNKKELNELFSILEEKQLKIVVGNKFDLVQSKLRADFENSFLNSYGEDILLFSTKTKLGLSELKEEIVNKLRYKTSNKEVLITTLRHKEALDKSKHSLSRAMVQIRENAPLELVSLDIRSSLSHLEEIVGITTNEEILGRIFSKFCIGK